MIDEFTKRRIRDQNEKLTLEQVMSKLQERALAAEAEGKTVKFVGIIVIDPDGNSEVNAARYAMRNVAETLGFLELMKGEVMGLFAHSSGDE